MEQTCAAYGCECEIDLQSRYPVLVNTEAETNHVVRLGKRFFGESNVSDRLLPMLAAEVRPTSQSRCCTRSLTQSDSPFAQDFAYYVEKKPGCFFFLGTKEEGRTNALCHSADFDFNDNVIPRAVEFWVRLVEDRLGLSLLP